MAYPDPEVGLVVSYSYLWSDEAAAGHAEGRKPRPCAVVMAVKRAEEDRPFVAVLPITHSPHSDPETAIEIPRPVAAHLGLDSDPCWVVLEDVNVFTWPGYDLRPISGQPGRYDYGLLPPRFFERIVKRFAQLRRSGRITETSRDDEA
ncbi:growth inhibitor PemK [Lentisalinibacter sediminis]|uniref:growth inhibitor PemK n=1 Tax=Lentisalinibacter sediminis TaxID=2992237 RepID=UPI00386C13B3